MMVFVSLVCLCIFLIGFFVLQYLQQQKAQQRKQKIIVYVMAIAAWLIVGLVVKFLYGVIIFVMTEKAEVIGYALVAGIIALVSAGYIYQYFLVDTLHDVRQFFMQALLFRGYTIRKKDVFAELEDQKARKIHRETSDEPFPDDEHHKKVKAVVDKEKLVQELQQLQARPIRSMHFDDELHRLNNNETVNISESWQLNSMKQASHLWYEKTTNVLLDPTKKLLCFSVHVADITKEHLQNKVSLYRFKQHLYEFLQAVNTEVWMTSYKKFFDSLECTCYRTELVNFDSPSECPFLKIIVSVSELKTLEGRFFDVGGFHKIGTVVFREGEPI